MEALLIGILYIVLYVIIIAIVIWLILTLFQFLGFPVPAIVVRLLWAAVAVIALILVVQLMFGALPMPRFR